MHEHIYTEFIEELYRNPKNKLVLTDANSQTLESSQACGDDINVQISFNEAGKIESIAWTGTGCVISQAAASVVSEISKGKTKEEILNMDTNSICELLNTDISPARINCALLGLRAIQQLCQ